MGAVVTTPNVAGAVVAPGVTEFGMTVHSLSAGAPEQLRTMGPANAPLIPATVRG